MMNSGLRAPVALDNELFAVDVNAEITRLCKLRFKAPGESVVELISFAAGLEPERIDVRLSRNRMSVGCTGCSLSGRVVERLQVAFDPARAPETRHRALVQLEQEGSLSLLAAFAVESSRVFVEWTDSDAKKRVELSVKRAPRVTEMRSPGDFAVVAVGRRRAWTKELETIRRRCRFAGFPIRLNGERLDKGLRLRDCLVSETMEGAGVRGVVGVPMEGDFLQLTRLSNGIAVEEVVRASAGGLALNAVVEIRRSEVATVISAVETIGHGLYERLASRFHDLGRSERQRVVELLMKQSTRTGDLELLSTLPAFARVDGPPMSLAEIKRAASAGRVFAVDPEIPVSNYETSNRLVLRLTGERRRFLEREAGIPLDTPPQKVGSAVLKPRLAARVRLAAERMEYFLGGKPGRPVPDQELDETERKFLEALRAELSRGAFSLSAEEGPLNASASMARGQRRPFMVVETEGGGRRCLISRSHPRVKAAAAAWAKNGSYLFPALFALTDGKGFYTDGDP